MLLQMNVTMTVKAMNAYSRFPGSNALSVRFGIWDGGTLIADTGPQVFTMQNEPQPLPVTPVTLNSGQSYTFGVYGPTGSNVGLLNGGYSMSSLVTYQGGPWYASGWGQPYNTTSGYNYCSFVVFT